MAIQPEEIDRFRANLDCLSEECVWYEDRGGAWCDVCGSGFLPTAREYLRLRAERSARAATIMAKAAR